MKGDSLRMHYHIGNMLIYQEFSANCECPMCRIRNILERRLADRYLNESAMMDDRRQEVNAKGFCAHHTKMMFSRDGKLALALQEITRLTTLRDKLFATDEPSDAAAQAEFFAHTHETCVICDSVEVSMMRYYSTVAMTYDREKRFRDLLPTVRGFCLPHYAQLLRYAKYAGKHKKEYLGTLTRIQRKSVDDLLLDLNKFTSKFDYRNADVPWGTAYDALPRCFIKMHGEEAE